jgi:hypothetical protein
MIGFNLFFLVVEVTENNVEEWHFENNQTDAKARVEEIKAGPCRHVRQPADETDFVDVWFPKDKKGMKTALVALDAKDLDAFVAATRKPCES